MLTNFWKKDLKLYYSRRSNISYNFDSYNANSYNFDSYNLISKKSSNLKPENLLMVLNFDCVTVIDIFVHCAYIFLNKNRKTLVKKLRLKILANTNVRSHQGLSNDSNLKKFGHFKILFWYFGVSIQCYIIQSDFLCILFVFKYNLIWYLYNLKCLWY